MKTKKFRFLAMALFVVVSIMPAMISCSDDDDDDSGVNKSELETLIAEAEDLINNTVEGTALGQYLYGSKDALQNTLDAAKVVYDDAVSTQVMIDNTEVALQAAIDAYEASAVTPIAPDALMGHWTFDEGSGNTVADYSGNGNDGTLHDGSATWGGGLPQWTADRYGNAGKALQFNEGSHIVIPYNAGLNPPNISIALWLKADEILENNRFMGLHSWNGYKFQLQSTNKAFFTIAATDGIYDRDNNSPELDVDTWYHVTVTFGDGHMKFYINGTMVQDWNDTPGTALPVSGYDLVIGQDSEYYAADDSNYDNDKIIPLTWGGYYHGVLDEVRIYNTVLTQAQVSAIHLLEKVAD